MLLWVNGPGGGEFVNRAYLEFVGVESDRDVRGYDWSRYVHPEDREQYLNAYQRAFAGQTRFTAEFRFRRHDGEYRWMRSDATPRFGDDGEFQGYVGATVDITERRNGRGRVTRRRPAEGRVPRDAGARAAQPAGADPQRKRGARAALRRRSAGRCRRSRCCGGSRSTSRACSTTCWTSRASRRVASTLKQAAARDRHGRRPGHRDRRPVGAGRSRNCCGSSATRRCSTSAATARGSCRA